MSEDRIRHAWQAGPFAAPPSLETLRSAAIGFDQTIRRRNRLEYGAGALVIGAFAIIGLTAGNSLVTLASALIVAGTLFVLWQLGRRGGAADLPEAASGMPLLTHHRAQLIRQRDALRSVAWWYLLPLLPGQLLFFYAVERGSTFGFAMMGIVLALFGGIWWLNAHGARTLTRQVAELDALVG